MQPLNIDTQIARVPINKNEISEILTQNKMCREQVSLELLELVGLVPPDPLSSSES